VNFTTISDSQGAQNVNLHSPYQHESGAVAPLFHSDWLTRHQHAAIHTHVDNVLDGTGARYTPCRRP